MSTDLTLHTPGAASLTEQMEFARAVTSGGRAVSLLPDAYRENPANVLIAVGLGASMGLSPAESLYRISVIKGKPTAGAELIAANVRKAGHRLRVVGDDTTVTASIVRADDPEFTFSVTRDLKWAQQMGLANNDNYKKQPGTMLQWRAITAVARLACPEALYGVAYTSDEVAETTARTEFERPAQRVTAADITGDSRPAEDVVDAEVADEPAADGITGPQLKKMGALMREAGLADRAGALAFVAETIGRDVASRNDLTKAEAGAVIDALEPLVAGPDTTDPWAETAATVAARDEQETGAGA